MTNVVVIAPHSDDEILGPGATIALFAQTGATVTVVTVCTELPEQFPELDHGSIQAEARQAQQILGVSDEVFLDLPTCALNQVPLLDLNRRIQQVLDERMPDIVLLPFPDRHLDHRIVCESAVVATRPYREGRKIRVTAMYETISETFWTVPGVEPTFSPHWTVDISETLPTKLQAFAAIPSRYVPFPGPRSNEALIGLAQLRGSQASCGYGEAFQLVRTSMAPSELARVFG